jgi:hypothetical protein
VSALHDCKMSFVRRYFCESKYEQKNADKLEQQYVGTGECSSLKTE